MSNGTNIAKLLYFTNLTTGKISNHKKIMKYESQGSLKVAKVSAALLRHETSRLSLLLF